MKRIMAMAVVLTAWWGSLSPVLGCAACFGRSDSSMAYGMNAGIMTLLVVILTLLSLIASFFVFVVRRASRLDPDSESNPPSI